MNDTDFADELQMRVWMFVVAQRLSQLRAAGASAEDAIVGAITACVGKPPVRTEVERRFVRLMIESGAPFTYLERFLAP